MAAAHFPLFLAAPSHILLLIIIINTFIKCAMIKQGLFGELTGGEMTFGEKFILTFLFIFHTRSFMSALYVSNITRRIKKLKIGKLRLAGHWSTPLV